MNSSTNRKAESKFPLVTIAVPVFNGAALLDRALRSLVVQSYPNSEILISDNASTDDTPDIIGRHASKDCRFQCFRQSATMPAFENFRFLLKHARGKYFFWAPHDDYWDSQYIATGVALFEANPLASMVMPTARFFDENEDEIRRHDPPYHLSSVNRYRRVATYLREGTTDHLVYALHRTEMLRDTIWSRSSFPEKAIIMHALVKGTVVDGHGMTYYNRYVAKSTAEIARAHGLPRYGYAFQVRSGVDVLREIWRWSGWFEALRLTPLYFFSQHWHKILVKWLLATLRGEGH